MDYDIPEGLGLRKEANAWGKLFQAVVKRFPRLTLRQATGLANQRYAHKTLNALDRLQGARLNRASQRLINSMGDVRNKSYSGPAFDAKVDYLRIKANKPKIRDAHYFREGEIGRDNTSIGSSTDAVRANMGVQSQPLPGGVRVRDMIRNGISSGEDVAHRSNTYTSPFRNMRTSSLPDIPVTPVK